MEILKNIEIKNKALWLRKLKTLVIADLHIGYEEALNKQGILVPRITFKEIYKEVKKLLKLNPKLIIINGDLKHEFGEISHQEWHDTLELLDLLLNRTKVVLVKGNHDAILGPIAARKNIEIVNYFIVGDICITHGHKVFSECFDKKIKIIIIGHNHSAISIYEGVKHELYKCFLLGELHGKKLVVMPSFFSVFEGSDIRKEKMLSPFLKNLSNFEIFVLNDRVYRFGKLKDI